MPESHPSAVIRAAVEALATQFFEPLVVGDLLLEAWAGATLALRQAGMPVTPGPPAYPAEPEAAYALHDAGFPSLERLAGTRLSLDDLTIAALDEILARRRDGHTHRLPRRRFWGVEPDASHPAGWASRTFGMVLTDTPPLAVADVLPGGPAQRAGLRRGQTVLAINGLPATNLRRVAAMACLDWEPAAVNRFSVAASDAGAPWPTVAADAKWSGQVRDLEVASELTPMPLATVLPGPFGLIRMDGFSASSTETAALRAALTGFEQAGAHGWIVDMRWCGGGPSVQLSRLLVDAGRLFSRLRHDDVHLPDGTVLPMRQDVDLDGTALACQRPLVVLIGPGSISGAESFAGPMQALGRAVLVGETTAGMCGVVHTVHLAPGWSINLTTHHTVFGPRELRLNRIGVTPNVLVRPTPDDEAAGRDPQLEAALAILRTRTSAA